MQIDADEIIEMLGGTSAVARRCDISMPSVSEWRKTGVPDSRLIELAADLESVSGGRFTRRGHWPTKYARIWPELAASTPPTKEPTP